MKRSTVHDGHLCQPCIDKDTTYLPAGSDVPNTEIVSVHKPVVYRKYDVMPPAKMVKLVIIGAHGGFVEQSTANEHKVTLVSIVDVHE